MNDQPQYFLNVNEGVDTLHRYPAFEQCNADGMHDRQVVDAETADALLALGDARRCEHCYDTTED